MLLNNDWIIGPRMGLEDITVWRLLGWLSSGAVDGIPTTIINQYPKIQKVCLAVDNEPVIQDWIKLTYKEGYVRGNYL